MSNPPNGLPVYRLITGDDSASFCERVSEALGLGYVLVGGPALTYNGEHVVAGQALIWAGSGARQDSGDQFGGAPN